MYVLKVISLPWKAMSSSPLKSSFFLVFKCKLSTTFFQVATLDPRSSANDTMLFTHTETGTVLWIYILERRKEHLVILDGELFLKE